MNNPGQNLIYIYGIPVIIVQIYLIFNFYHIYLQNNIHRNLFHLFWYNLDCFALILLMQLKYFNDNTLIL